MSGSFEPADRRPGERREGDESPQPVPTEGRLLGLDYGTRRIGIAVCDDRQIIASPLDTYHRRGNDADGRFLRELVREQRVVGVVVGLPVHMSGDEGGKAAEAREFADWVARITSLPVACWDERYTTALAEDHLRDAGVSRDRRRELRDRIAAQMILQSFIDSSDRTRLPPPLR